MDGGAIGYGKFHNGTLRMLQSFVRGATLTYVNNGGSGAAFKCHNPAKTPFVNLATGEKVHTILIKFGMIDEEDEDYEINIAGRDFTFSPLTKPEFSDEVAMQLRVLSHSAHICPSILMYRIVEEGELNALFGTKVVDCDLSISLIVMELVDKDDGVSDVLDETQLAMARAKFLFMGMHGINHGDFHLNNLLLSRTGALYVIDFGRATTLSPEAIGLIAESVEAKDYVQGLRTLTMTGKYSNERVDATPNPDFDLCEASQWENTGKVNRAIKRMVRGGHFLTHYEKFYGWVFSDDFLNLTKKAKKGITEQWEELKRLDTPRAFGREFRGDSLTSFGSSLSTSTGGRTRRKRQTW